MTGDRIAGILFVLLAMTLVLRGFAVRRLPMRRTLVLGLLWVAIFAGAFLIARLFA